MSLLIIHCLYIITKLCTRWLVVYFRKFRNKIETFNDVYCHICRWWLNTVIVAGIGSCPCCLYWKGSKQCVWKISQKSLHPAFKTMKCDHRQCTVLKIFSFVLYRILNGWFNLYYFDLHSFHSLYHKFHLTAVLVWIALKINNFKVFHFSVLVALSWNYLSSC